MGITRQSIIKGPGIVTFKGHQFIDISGISASLESATSDISTSLYGKLDTIKTDQSAKISMTPLMRFNDEAFDILFPQWVRTPNIGQSLFGDSDEPLSIQSTKGTTVKFAAAALTKVPELYLSPVKTCLGSAEWTALLPNGESPDSQTKKLYIIESENYSRAYPPIGAMTGLHWTGNIGSLSIPDTVDGWTISVNMATKPVTIDSVGTIDYLLTGVNLSARCTPVGLTEADILGALPTLNKRGSSLINEGTNLTLESQLFSVELKNVALISGPLNWGATSLRAGELMFTANITVDGDLFKFSTKSE